MMGTSLKKLDGIQYQALGLCSGATRTTPASALLVEMRKVPRFQLSFNYWTNLKGYSEDHPTQNTLKPCWEKDRREMKSFGWSVEQKTSK